MNAASALILGMMTVNGAPQGEVLDFTAKWCGPCQSVAPIVEKLKRQGYPIRKVDVNEQPELARKYRIDSIPQFVLVIDGKEKTRVKGIQNESSLKRLLAQIPQPEEVEDAEEIIAKSDGPRRIGGIPIPFLGKSKPIDPEDVEAVRGQTPEASENKVADVVKGADPQDATVRLSVNNSGSINKGTGTIIESTAERTLAISCGHLFRHSNAGTKISVEVFENGQPQSYQARLVRFDDHADVGLIAFASQKILPRIRIAADPQAVRPRDLVFSMGCGNGDDPTKWQMFVKSVDGYVGKSITECTQAPVYGRSGGGLFNRGGELIGICMAADKKNNTGLYSGLSEIHALLDQLSLTSLYRTEKTLEQPVFENARPGNLEQQLANRDRPDFNTAPEIQHAVSLKEASRENPSVVAAKPVDLTEDEIAVIAASLQMSGPDGVRVSIEKSANDAHGHRITIVNRAARSHSAIARAASPERRSLGQESFEWSNLLESRESEKPVASSNHDLPEWARERIEEQEAHPFRRNLH